MNKKANASKKLKEVQANPQSNAFAPHLILPQRTQAHPPPKKNKNIFHYIFILFTTFAQI
jgi:hypothetical protein